MEKKICVFVVFKIVINVYENVCFGFGMRKVRGKLELFYFKKKFLEGL